LFDAKRLKPVTVKLQFTMNRARNRAGATSTKECLLSLLLCFLLYLFAWKSASNSTIFN